MGFDAVFGGECGRIGNAFEFLLDPGRVAVEPQMRVAPGVQFDDGCLEPHRGINLPGIGFDEQAHPDARIGQARYNRGQLVVQSGSVEPAFGGAFLAPLGHDARGVRFVPQCNFQHFLGRRHFKVERQAGRSLDAGKVAVADMPPVFTQVRSDAVSANMRDNLCCAHRIGMIPAARVPDRRDMVDIDAEAEVTVHGQALRLPGFTASLAASSGGSSSGA